MSLLNFYKEVGIRYIAKKHGIENYKSIPISQIQTFLISQAQGKDLFDYSSELWNEWLESDEGKKQTDKELEIENDDFNTDDEKKVSFKLSSPFFYYFYSSAIISETATKTASPLMAILSFSRISQNKCPPRFDA